MQLGQIHQLVFNQMLLDFSLYDPPECFDRIKLGTVWRQKHKHEVEILCQLGDFFGVMAGMIVEDDEDFFIRVRKGLS